MRHFYRAATLFLLFGAIFYNQSFAGAAVGLFGQLEQALALPFLVIKDLTLSRSLIGNIVKLELENQDLRAQAMASALGIKGRSGGLIPAKIFASYPFNDKSSITIAVGKNDGVKVGAAVLASPHILLGQVSNVGSDWSEVRTLFDVSHAMPVRIGERGVPALLSGGAGITLGMIDKSRVVRVDDNVYAAVRGIPYGLKIGTLGAIREPNGAAFKEADVILPYSLGEFEQVLVLLN